MRTSPSWCSPPIPVRRARDRLYPASARTPATSLSRSPSCLATSATRTWTRCPDTGGGPPPELPPRGGTYYNDRRRQTCAQAIGPAPPEEPVMFIPHQAPPHPAAPQV